MARHRLGVVALVPEPAAAAVDGLRAALGDPGRRRVPAHCTLLPPVNVRADELDAALAVVAAAAARTRPFAVAAGPAATFLPDNPVVHLPVGEGATELTALRERLDRRPLQRPPGWPYVPHVTLAEELDPARIPDAVGVLAGFTVEWRVERIHLMEREADGVWRPRADATLAPPAVVGRGGWELVLGVHAVVEPRAVAVLEAAGCPAPARAGGDVVAVVARTPAGTVVGVGWAVVAGPWARLGAVAVDPACRGLGTGRHVLAALEHALAERGVARVDAVPGAGGGGEGFLARLGWAPGPPGRDL